MSGFTENRADASEQVRRRRRGADLGGGRGHAPPGGPHRRGRGAAPRPPGRTAAGKTAARPHAVDPDLAGSRPALRVQEETNAVVRDLQDAAAELEVLGVALLHGRTGLVGFPTMVNDRPAYFSWRPGEETLGFWNYADDLVRRPVPASWRSQQGPGTAQPGQTRTATLTLWASGGRQPPDSSHHQGADAPRSPAPSTSASGRSGDPVAPLNLSGIPMKAKS